MYSKREQLQYVNDRDTNSSLIHVCKHTSNYAQSAVLKNLYHNPSYILCLAITLGTRKSFREIIIR